MTHLTPDELIDAIEGTLAPDRHGHLVDCGTCRREAERLSAILQDTRETQIPEPGPVYWDRLSARVREAVRNDELGRFDWRTWLRFPVLAPVAGLALIVIALAASVAQQRGVVSQPSLETSAATGVAEPSFGSDQEWNVVSELVDGIDFDAALEAGIAVEPGAADRVVTTLTDSEQRELIRLLKAETDKSGG